MPSGVHLTGVQQGRIVALNNLGYSARQIEQQVKVSKHAILNYLHDPLTGTRGHLSGRKSITSLRDKRRILRSASNSYLSCAGIKAATETKASKRTILRILSSCPHIKLLVAEKKPPCFPATKVKRLLFANNHLLWKSCHEDVAKDCLL